MSKSNSSTIKQFPIPELVHTRRAAEILGRSAWKVVRQVVKFKLLKEYGRTLRLDDEAETELLAAGNKLVKRGEWDEKERSLFGDIVMLVRDTGTRNERELYRVRIANLAAVMKTMGHKDRNQKQMVSTISRPLFW